MEKYIDILMLGKCNPLGQLREQDAKNTNHSCGTLQGVR